MDKKEDFFRIENLKTYYFTRQGTIKAVNNVSFSIRRGEMVGLVGESGCGKSATALSILRLVPYPGKIVGGRILLEGEDLLIKTEEEMRQFRGSRISMVFQDPLSSLNPVYTVGWQIAEVYKLHEKNIPRGEITEKCIKMLDTVKISDAVTRVKTYPHQFSGGMRQRILIAIALAHKPSLLIADEPTTALDVTVQAEIMDLIESLKRDLNLSVLFISHDIHLVAERCERINVMYAGEIIESTDSERLLKNPLHPYTQGLLDSIPRIDTPKGSLKPIRGDVPDLINLPQGCYFSPRCEKAKSICKEIKPKLVEIDSGHYCKCHFPDIKNRSSFPVSSGISNSSDKLPNEKIMEISGLKVYFPLAKGIIDRIFAGGKIRYIKAVDGVSLTIFRQETIGVVGESGCGKTSLGRAMTFLTCPTKGKVIFEGKDLSLLRQDRMRKLYQEIQFIFQDPFSSLNPKMTVGQILERPLINSGMKERKKREERIKYLLNRVGLSIKSINKYPHEFSGGQRQRISIVRALVTNPKFVVADEPTSSLDVSIQAQILQLLAELKEELQLTMVLITHNLGVVKYICDRVAIMYLGKIMEIGRTDEIFLNPLHPYTRALLSAIPTGTKRKSSSQRFFLQGVVPSPVDLPTGCRLQSRCPFRTAKCSEIEPELIDVGKRHLVACHRI